jgi:hypothetical protein
MRTGVQWLAGSVGTMVSLLVAIAGCSRMRARNPIVGMWDYQGVGAGYRFQIASDGTILVSNSWAKVKGQWQTENGKLYLTVDGTHTATPYTVVGDTLVTYANRDTRIYCRAK